MLVVLDGRRVSSEADLHRELARLLDFGPFYGANLDALWDRLSTDVERPMHLLWTDSGTSRAAMSPLSFERVERILQKTVEQDTGWCLEERFTYELA
ncbi:barstar family protein [Catenuloplanes japonicus]|uniref:barstar family protein n=1 Tax=Catenuloplanes japonicus TaxID=33876 RepID=UPI000524687D|nr:barstar family protein [Catenuloplanes japonicus]